MDLNWYQNSAFRTSGGYGEVGSEKHLLTSALSLAGEVGELCNLLKKIVRHGHELDKRRLKDELGDILWYVADLCSALDLDLDEVAIDNLQKLRHRYPKGFSEFDSQNRSEV